MAGNDIVLTDFANYYVNEMSSRIVAASGRPSDRYHLGKLILLGLKDTPSDFLMQIDGGTEMSETAGSVLERSVRCATCFRTLGLGFGDVVALMAPNNLDLCIPFYASQFLGIAVSPTDWTLGVKETSELLNITRPKLIFCLHDRSTDIQKSIDLINLDAKIITFGETDGYISFNKFLEKYGDAVSVNEFKPADFDSEENNSFMIWTSGTTALQKATVLTHKNITVNAHCWVSMFEKFPTPTRLCMINSPLQWMTAIYVLVLSPIMQFTRLQTSHTLTPRHALQMIRKYKPTFSLVSPPFLTLLMRSADYQEGDFKSFDRLLIGGSAVTDDVVKTFKALSPTTQLCPGYGMSETGAALLHDGSQQICALTPTGLLKCRLVDSSTGLDITKPNMPGELWMSGPSIFKCYYKQPEETKETLSIDGWMKTGDIFYKDENGRYFFVERAKMLLKYRIHQVSPVEVESVIRQHPGVMDAAVAGIPDEECGDLIVACVVRRTDYDVTAQEIKDLVKDSLADSKRLRGGVIFLKDLPMTSSSKIDRKKLREVVLHHELARTTQLCPGYGMSETGSALMHDGSQQKYAMKPTGLVKCRLVDSSTGLDITKPNMPGELLMSGPSLFKVNQLVFSLVQSTEQMRKTILTY